MTTVDIPTVTFDHHVDVEPEEEEEKKEEEREEKENHDEEPGNQEETEAEPEHHLHQEEEPIVAEHHEVLEQNAAEDNHEAQQDSSDEDKFDVEELKADTPTSLVVDTSLEQVFQIDNLYNKNSVLITWKLGNSLLYFFGL